MIRPYFPFVQIHAFHTPNGRKISVGTMLGQKNGYRCVQIKEPSDPHTWRDNYFCSSGHKKDPGMRWSYHGPIRGMKCTQIREPSDPNTWADNYLCLPSNSPLNLQWSYHGPIRGKACIRWIEPSDPHTWRDNYLCGKLHTYFIYFTFIYLTERQRVRLVRENIKPRSCCTDPAMARSIQQDRGLVFSRTA